MHVDLQRHTRLWPAQPPKGTSGCVQGCAPCFTQHQPTSLCRPQEPNLLQTQHVLTCMGVTGVVPGGSPWAAAAAPPEPPLAGAHRWMPAAAAAAPRAAASGGDPRGSPNRRCIPGGGHDPTAAAAAASGGLGAAAWWCVRPPLCAPIHPHGSTVPGVAAWGRRVVGAPTGVSPAASIGLPPGGEG
jgi:hypothetical protein